jgi:hypothetical protein
MKLEQTVLIARPVPLVFAFRSTLDNAPTWRHDVRAATLDTPGPTQMGTRCTELRQGPNGATQEWRLEVTEFEPDHVLRIATSCGDLRVDERHSFVADGRQTRYTLHLEITSGEVPPVGLQKRLVEVMLSLKWLLEDRGLGHPYKERTG